MKFLILVSALVPTICASQLILDSDGWLMQELHDNIYEPTRVRRQAQQQQQQQQQQPQVQYRPYSQAPSQIKELLQLQQARQPVVNLPAQPPPNIDILQQKTQATGGYQPQVQYGNPPQQPTYKNQAAAIAAQYRPQGQPQYQPQGQRQYQPLPQFPQSQPQGQPQYNQQYRPQG